MADRTLGWARPWPTARPFSRPTPRAGAWYPVVGEADDARVVLEIKGKRVAVLKKLLEIRPDRPTLFTVVVRPREEQHPAKGTDADRGPVYAVCPVCGERVSVLREQLGAICPDCGHSGDIAWWETG